MTEISLLSRFATYSVLPSRSAITPFGSKPVVSVRTTLSVPVSISETVSSHELATNSFLPSVDIAMPRRDGFHHAPGLRIHHAHFVACLAHHVQPASIG